METDRASQWIEKFFRMFPLMHETPEVARLWAALVEKHGVKGFRANDARYVALMQARGIDKLMT